jgi:hypothetical protein
MLVNFFLLMSTLIFLSFLTCLVVVYHAIVMTLPPFWSSISFIGNLCFGSSMHASSLLSYYNHCHQHHNFFKCFQLGYLGLSRGLISMSKSFEPFIVFSLLFSFLILFPNGELILINCQFHQCLQSAIYAIYVTCFVLMIF